MRKIFLVVISVLILASCQTYPKNPEQYARTKVYWDETLPKEKCAGLFIEDGLTVTNYNGVTVNWGKNTLVYLPPGNVTLLMDVNYVVGYTQYYGKNWPFQWTFNEGDERYLRGWVIEENPVILVIDGNDKTRFYEQPSYKVPVQKGPTILE